MAMRSEFSAVTDAGSTKACDTNVNEESPLSFTSYLSLYRSSKFRLRCPFAKIGINNAINAKIATELTLLLINLFLINFRNIVLISRIGSIATK